MSTSVEALQEFFKADQDRKEQLAIDEAIRIIQAHLQNKYSFKTVWDGIRLKIVFEPNQEISVTLTNLEVLFLAKLIDYSTSGAEIVSYQDLEHLFWTDDQSSSSTKRAKVRRIIASLRKKMKYLFNHAFSNVDVDIVNVLYVGYKYQIKNRPTLGEDFYQ